MIGAPIPGGVYRSAGRDEILPHADGLGTRITVADAFTPTADAALLIFAFCRSDISSGDPPYVLHDTDRVDLTATRLDGEIIAEAHDAPPDVVTGRAPYGPEPATNTKRLDCPKLDR